MILCVSGLPASGKSTVGSLLTRIGWTLVESGQVAAALLGSADFHQLSPAEQEAFRARALSLVEGDTPNHLSREIASRVHRSGDLVAVIGVRQVSTLLGLRHLFPSGVHLLYVDTQPATCAVRYSNREGRSAGDYFRILNNPVEADQQALRDMADIVVDNEGPLEQLPDRLDQPLKDIGA